MPGTPVGRDDDPSQALLLWLLRYPLLRAEDLAAVTGYSRQRTYVQLARLEAAGLIEVVRVPTLGRPGARLYHVSAVGIQELAHAYGHTVWRAAHVWGADEAGLQRLLPRAPALVAVQTVVMALITGVGSTMASAGCTQGAERAGPGPQQMCSRTERTEWAWERDYRFALTGRRATSQDASACSGSCPSSRSIRIDAYVRLRMCPPAAPVAATDSGSHAGADWGGAVRSDTQSDGKTSYGLFVLYDVDILDPGRPLAMLRALLRALLRGRQALEADGGTMPALLLLVPDAHRAQRWQALNARMAMERWLAQPLDGGILVVPPPWQNDDPASRQQTIHTSTDRAGSRDRDGDNVPNLWQANWLALNDSGSRRLAALLTTAHEPTLPVLSTVPPVAPLAPVARSGERHQQPKQPTPSRAARVIGHFNDRADRWAESVPWRGALGWSLTAGGGGSRSGPEPRSRPHSGRELLTLLALRLDARHDALLALLAAHPLLSGEELAAIVGITPASATVYLRHLRRLSLVAPAPDLMLAGGPAVLAVPAGIRGLHERYALTPLGIQLVAARSGRTCNGAPRAERRDGRDFLWVNTSAAAYAPAYDREIASLVRVPAHTAGIYQFVASLFRAASTARAGGQAHRVVWWETGRACARQYRETDGWHALRPDAAGEYLAGTRRLRFWLEWDRGTMRRRDLEAKFAAYAHYVRSREWCADGNVPLPHLLVVTSDYGQETRILQTLQRALVDATPLAINITQAAAVDEHGPIAPIWRPWTRDASGVRRLERSAVPFDHT